MTRGDIIIDLVLQRSKYNINYIGLTKNICKIWNNLEMTV
jgi:hypothetical protein